MKIQAIRKSVIESRLIWNKHALERMLKRGISRDEVKQAILYGEIIEEYPNDYPFPSYLIFHCKSRPLHIVLSYNEKNRNIYVITTYIPDFSHFESDSKTRRIR